MKRPQPDIGDLLKLSFISNMGGARKFKRLWGTELVDGIEVLTHKQYYYPEDRQSDNFEKLFRHLNLYEDVTTAEFKGISSAWLYLNRNKESELPAADSAELAEKYNDFVSSNLNQLWWDAADGPMPSELTLTTSIVIEAELNTTRDAGVSTTPLLSPSWPTSQLISAIVTNYDAIWDTCLISHKGVGVINKGSVIDTNTNVVTQDEDDLSPDDPWLAVIARNALRTDGISCTIKDVEIGIGRNEAGRMYNTYALVIEIPYTSFTTSSPFVSLISTDLAGTYSSDTRVYLSYPNGYYTQQAVRAMDQSMVDADPDVITRPYRLFEDEAADIDLRYSEMWYESGGLHYLKADAFSNPRLYNTTFKELYKYVLSIIDSGYKKKKVPLWKKIIAVAVFVVSVLLLQPQLGSWALAIVSASAIMNLLTLAFTVLGMESWASAFAAVSKMIEPLVLIASLYTLALNLKALGARIAEKGITTVIKEGVEAYVKSIIAGAKTLLSGVLNNISLNFLTRLVNILTIPLQIRLAAIGDRNRDLQAEYDQLIEETSRETDVLQGFSLIYSSPATADWSMYAATFDYPYERGGGRLSLGNIQRTTKQAMREASYEKEIFDNRLLV